ncbi:MAG: phenylalanine--tRNA ligase subunit beta, partial [Candidatus Shapirobacteria bacterium]|nr:phenylalanine--tRNA ligase subunit beta [Candidatus Shapirobacteria bacterium]
MCIRDSPNADRLRIVEVDISPATNAQGKRLSVVCGASNIEVGQKVPVALIGAKLPSGLEIKEVEIRGVKSCGMLCAEDELGLGQDHSGIMILKEEAEVGTEFANYQNKR